MSSPPPVKARRISPMNPATGEVLRELECADGEQVKEIVARAAAAQPSWQTTPLEKRLRMVKRFQHLLVEGKAQVARTITAETGKPYVEALLTEILVSLDAARFLLTESHGFFRERPLPHLSLATKLKTGRLVREPHGVIGIISPWNYPFSIPAVQVLFALVAGNTVVLKPSELAPLSSLELSALITDAGAPQNVLQLAIGDGATGQALVESAIQKLVFTGSVSTGRGIAQLAASRLLPVVLELGGKDPMIVLEDADLELASSGAVWGAFLNAGQACLAIERCYVQRRVYEEFLSRSVQKARQLRVGNGMDLEVDVGPLINRRQLRKVEEHVEDARARGARVLAGGEPLPALGANFYAPTVLAGATHEMRIMREESFGPVLPVMAFESEQEAIRLANDSEYGLAASVWTGNRRRGEALARQIQAGTVMVNDAVCSFGIAEAPHGGIKSSGIGRTHGRLGLEEMVRLKYLDSDRLPHRKKPWWYAYGSRMATAADAFLDFEFARGIRTRLAGGLRALPLLRGPKL